MSGFAMAHAVRARMKKKMADGGMADVDDGTGDPNDGGAQALAKGLSGGGGSGGSSGGGMASMLPMLAMLAKGGMAGGSNRMAAEVMRRRAGAQSPEMLAEGGDVDDYDKYFPSPDDSEEQTASKKAALLDRINKKPAKMADGGEADDAGFTSDDQRPPKPPMDQRTQSRMQDKTTLKQKHVFFDTAALPQGQSDLDKRAAQREAQRQQQDEDMHNKVGYSEGGQIDADHEQQEHLLTPEERKQARRGMLTAILSSIHQRHGK